MRQARHEMYPWPELRSKAGGRPSHHTGLEDPEKVVIRTTRALILALPLTSRRALTKSDLSQQRFLICAVTRDDL